METLTIRQRINIELRAAIQVIIVAGIICGGILVKFFIG